MFAVYFLFKLCTKSRTLNIKEICFITYAGMIRGAIALALVLTLPHLSADGLSCSVTSVPLQDCFTVKNY